MRKPSLLILACVLGLLGLGGCKNEEAEIEKKNTQVTQDLQTIMNSQEIQDAVMRTNGNWAALPAAEQQALADKFTSGNGAGVAMAFEAAAQKARTDGRIR